MVRCLEKHPMAASRLTDSQKKNIVEGYRLGKSTSALAETFGCSSNTVTRTVKAILPKAEYSSLKASRSKVNISRGELQIKEEVRELNNVEIQCDLDPRQSNEDLHSSVSERSESIETALENSPINFVDNSSGPLALDDADDFTKNSQEASNEEQFWEVPLIEGSNIDLFQEIVPLTSISLSEQKNQVSCEPFSPGILPRSVFMLVDKTVELDIKPLSEFPELGSLSPEDKNRQAICLFINQRTAKRQCGRTQIVIKIPDTEVFSLSIPFLLAKGITRLVLENLLISIDTNK